MTLPNLHLPPPQDTYVTLMQTSIDGPSSYLTGDKFIITDQAIVTYKNSLLGEI